MLTPSLLVDVQTKLKPEDFASQKHKIIYEAILRVQGKPDDHRIGVWAEIQRAGKTQFVDEAYISLLVKDCPMAGLASHYAENISRFSKARALRSSCAYVMQEVDAYEEIGDGDLYRWHSELTTRVLSSKASDKQEDLAPLLDKVNPLGAFKASDSDLKTHLVDLDAKAALFDPGAVTIIAARPRMGKSTLMRHLIRANGWREKSIIFSFEESEPMLTQKLVCEEAYINYSQYARGYLTEELREKFTLAKERLKGHQVKIVDDQLTPEEVVARVRRAILSGWIPRLIFVDHFQHMKFDRERGENDSASFGRGALLLAQLVKEIGATLILLAQLNRKVEDRTEQRPMLSDLRDTGRLEEVATNVIFLWAKDVEENERKVYIAKQRNGPCGELDLSFFGEYGRFENYIQGSQV